MVREKTHHRWGTGQETGPLEITQGWSLISCNLETPTQLLTLENILLAFAILDLRPTLKLLQPFFFFFFFSSPFDSLSKRSCFRISEGKNTHTHTPQTASFCRTKYPLCSRAGSPGPSPLVSQTLTVTGGYVSAVWACEFGRGLGF